MSDDDTTGVDPVLLHAFEQAGAIVRMCIGFASQVRADCLAGGFDQTAAEAVSNAALFNVLRQVLGP